MFLHLSRLCTSRTIRTQSKNTRKWNGVSHESLMECVNDSDDFCGHCRTHACTCDNVNCCQLSPPSEGTCTDLTGHHWAPSSSRCRQPECRASFCVAYRCNAVLMCICTWFDLSAMSNWCHLHAVCWRFSSSLKFFRSVKSLDLWFQLDVLDGSLLLQHQIDIFLYILWCGHLDHVTNNRGVWYRYLVS